MKKINLEELLTGDLVAVGNGTSDFSTAIVASNNISTRSYDHVGLVEKQGDAIFIWNANPKWGVVGESWQDFLSREEESGERAFHFYRLKEHADFGMALKRIHSWEGLPYNYSFIRTDGAFYCSDLIGRAFPEGIFKSRPMKFGGDFWTVYYDDLDLPIPDGEPGFHPADMVQQENMRCLGAYKGERNKT